jgi:DNA-binding response OmpR family regulator
MTKPLALIIEDDPQLSQIFSLSLRTEFETETIIDGNTALARLAEVVPSVVVLDLNLPGTSGKNILSQIRGDKRLSTARVILATADALQANALSEEADVVLLKPISPVQLRELALRLRPIP